MNNTTTTITKQHFYWLDAMRFIAAFMVLLSHSRNIFFPVFSELPVNQQNIATMAFMMFCRMGHEAVVVFFVLSGFLVGGRGFERIQNGTMNVKGYAIDRFSRIYPPLLMAILFYFITSLVVPGTPFSFGTAVGNLFNLQGICCDSLIGPFWSLSYEVWFYIVLGMLAVALTAKSNRTKFAGFCLFVASVSVFVLGLKMHYLLIWMLGAVAYLVRPFKKSKLLLIVSFLGFFCTCVLWQFSVDTHSLKWTIPSINKEFLELVMSLMICLLIQQVILFEPKGKIVGKIENFLGKMANFSYTLYLSHRTVFLWITAFIWSKGSCSFTATGLLEYIAILLISLFVCWLLYLISEKQSPKIKACLKAKLL